MGLDLDSSKVSWRVTAEQRLLARPTKAQRFSCATISHGGGLGDLFWVSDEAWPQSDRTCLRTNQSLGGLTIDG